MTSRRLGATDDDADRYLIFAGIEDRVPNAYGHYYNTGAIYNVST